MWHIYRITGDEKERRLFPSQSYRQSEKDRYEQMTAYSERHTGSSAAQHGAEHNYNTPGRDGTRTARLRERERERERGRKMAL